MLFHFADSVLVGMGGGASPHKQGARSAFFMHDMFNLVALSAVVGLAALHLTRTTDVLALWTRGDWNQTFGVAEEPLFFALMHAFWVYLGIDSVWVLLQPAEVPGNAAPIVLHHLACSVIVALPYHRPARLAWLTCASLLVEVNTLLLVLRRNLRQGGLAHRAVHAAFLSSWVMQRLLGFPMATVLLWREWRRHSEQESEQGGRWRGCNWSLLGPTGGLFLSCLSYYWTLQLLRGKDRDRGDGGSKEA